MTEKEKFEAWFEEAKKQGMQQFHVTLNPDFRGSEEEVYAALNRMIKEWEMG